MADVAITANAVQAGRAIRPPLRRASLSPLRGKKEFKLKTMVCCA
jgi:hypothetical protein